MSKKRPSPDSVICIDLTENDSDHEQNKRLVDVRRRLNRSDSSTKKKVKVKDENIKAAAISKLNLAEHGLEIVQPMAQPLVPVARAPSASAVAEDEDEIEIEIMGAKNELRLPHLRQDCSQFKFDATPFNRSQCYSSSVLETNAKCCDLCYCYVCDCPVKDCTSWRSESRKIRTLNHCCGNNAIAFWKSQRAVIKAAGSESSLSLPVVAPRRPGGTYHAAPAAPSVSRGQDPAVCRKCNQRTCNNRPRGNAPSTIDLCTICGRVASEESFGKVQNNDFKKKDGDVFLGSREIKFRIQSRDPRTERRYSQNWIRNAGDPLWQFSETDMQDDAFKHKIGTCPSIKTIWNLLQRGVMCEIERDVVLLQNQHEVDLLGLINNDYTSSNIVACWNKVDREGVSSIFGLYNDTTLRSAHLCFRIDI